MGSFRNRIINGDMRIDQRGSGTTPITVAQQNYSVDRWQQEWVVTSGTMTAGQLALSASETPYQLGFRYKNRWTVTSGIVLAGSNGANYVLPKQVIEGYNIADLNWGTSFGSPVTISFWFRGNVGGTYQSAIRVAGGGYTTFNTNFTVPAGVWTYVTYTAPPPPNGSAPASTTNGTGFEIYIGNYNAYAPLAAPGTWTTSYPYQSTYSNANWWQNAGNFIEFTGVQLEKGTVATPFEFRPYATELALCQRYYYQETMPSVSNYNIVCPMTIISGTTAMGVLKYPVTMRSNAVTFTSSGTFTLDWYTVNANSIGALGMSPNGQGSSNYAQLYATSVGNGSVGSVTVGQVRFLCQNTAGGYLAISAEL